MGAHQGEDLVGALTYITRKVANMPNPNDTMPDQSASTGPNRRCAGTFPAPVMAGTAETASSSARCQRHQGRPHPAWKHAIPFALGLYMAEGY